VPFVREAPIYINLNREIKNMPAPYSIDLREKIVLAHQNNEGSMKLQGKRFKVSVNFISTLIERFKKTGKVDPKPHGGGRRPAINAPGQSFIRNLLSEQPDLTQIKICREYNKHFEPVTCSTVDRTLNKMKITRKKKTLFDARKNTSENQEKLLDYKMNIVTKKPEKLIYIDFISAVRNITRNYESEEKGQRAFVQILLRKELGLVQLVP
jgi:transposase